MTGPSGEDMPGAPARNGIRPWIFDALDELILDVAQAQGLSFQGGKTTTLSW